jgi:hypothetical protein
MDNMIVHALGNAPTSEFVLDPEGRIARKRAWGNAKLLQKDLIELVGKVETPTDPADLGLTSNLHASAAPRGQVERLRVPRNMETLLVEPQLATSARPFYAKLRAEANRQLINRGDGLLYLGFHLDPIYDFHWNNLTDPIRVEVQAGDGTVVSPSILFGPEVDAVADSDPREFLVDVSGWPADGPLEVSVRYFACNDERGLCLAVTQDYVVHRIANPDAGWAERRNPPKRWSESQ